VKGEMADGKRL